MCVPKRRVIACSAGAPRAAAVRTDVTRWHAGKSGAEGVFDWVNPTSLTSFPGRYDLNHIPEMSLDCRLVPSCDRHMKAWRESPLANSLL
jgi:hypothetical protein